jgi:hypothetical protein
MVMKRRRIPVMTPEELERLTTKQLLARLVQLRQCEESVSLSDSGEDGVLTEILFKDSPEWSAAYEQLKEILAQREHVAKGVELVVARKQRAKLARTIDRRAGRRT